LRGAPGKTKTVGGDSKTFFSYAGAANPSLEGALNDALERGGENVVTDATIEVTVWWVPFVSRVEWAVTGDVRPVCEGDIENY
jgi:hypothetical protein